MKKIITNLAMLIMALLFTYCAVVMAINGHKSGAAALGSISLTFILIYVNEML